jgi:hypothetical protein
VRAKTGLASNGSIFADRWEKHKTSLWLFECSGFPPLTYVIEAATGLPEFGFMTMI